MNGQTVSTYVEEIDRVRQTNNLSSALRVHVLSTIEAERDAWREKALGLRSTEGNDLALGSSLAAALAAENEQEHAAKLALQKACDIAGGQLPLAKLIRTTQPTVWYWLHKSRKGAGSRFVKRIEAATGVPCHALRPDIYPVPSKKT